MNHLKKIDVLVDNKIVDEYEVNKVWQSGPQGEFVAPPLLLDANGDSAI